ncbi:MAG: LemA family protein [Candidatus Omnitrophica bacterium]|nr:LemA family protein [Candidatus Omnitrophota bacterium]
MKKFLLVSLAVVVGLVIFGLAAFSAIYNRLVQGDESVKSAWSQVENVYQRRLDLIPNLVETVKGYAAHERETLEAVTEARSKITQMTLTPEVVNDPNTLAAFEAMQGNLSSALSRLLAVIERYPDLKANQNFLTLQAQLEGTENRIAVERMRYNEVARQFNTTRRVFPNILVANLFGFQEKVYFKAEEAASRVPKVEF